MHIYYYDQDGYYYVMNKNGKLFKYSVTNNIEMILQLENLIDYLKCLKNAEETSFSFKAIQELNFSEKNILFNALPALLATEYCMIPDQFLTIFTIQSILIHHLNYKYYHKKKNIKEQEAFYDTLLEDNIDRLQQQLQFLHELSSCKKEECALSELNTEAQKIYLSNVEEMANSIEDDIDIQMNANFYPFSFFQPDYAEEEYNEEYYLEYTNKKRNMKTKYLLSDTLVVLQKIYYQELQLKSEHALNYFTYSAILAAIIHLNSTYPLHNCKIALACTSILSLLNYLIKEIKLSTQQDLNLILKLEHKD